MKRRLQVLDYVASQEEAILTYSRSQMTLATRSDAGYLNKPEAWNWDGDNFFMLNNTVFPPNNGTILTISQIIKNAMSSAAEAKLGALYISIIEAA